MNLTVLQGVPQIEVSFALDANGILNVSASDKGTGQSSPSTRPSVLLTNYQGKIKSVTIKSEIGRLTKEQIDNMVAEGEKYKEEDRATAERTMSRNELENYAINLRNQVSDAEGLGGALDLEEKEMVRLVQINSGRTSPLT